MENFDPVGGGFIVEKLIGLFSGGGIGGGSDAVGTIDSILFFLKFVFIFFFILFVIGIVYTIYQLMKFRPGYNLVSEERSAPQQKIAKKRFEEIMKRFEMGTESDWKLAVIEADGLLDEVFKKLGFPGETLGERISALSAQEVGSIGELREAHGIRNKLAHTPGVNISKQDAERAIRNYKKVLEDLEVI